MQASNMIIWLYTWNPGIKYDNMVIHLESRHQISLYTWNPDNKYHYKLRIHAGIKYDNIVIHLESRHQI